ncbi:helix-turn-helix domain-containing protein [Bifidobacterium catulorum]
MELLDVKDPRIITRLIQSGQIKALKVGGRYKINLQSLVRFANCEGR